MIKYLTRSRKVIMRLADKGFTSKEISKKMGTSVRTVETHRHKMNKDFGVHSFDEAIAIAKKKKML
jgi:DNA-binding NarL/FixJ family response regulator